jgi:uncharacterized FAD-dependent dehydrogenase
MIQLDKSKKVLLIEQGKKVEDRNCPIEKLGKCIHCRPMCNITCGFSGAGAFSDGKLSLCEEVGGDLPNLIGAEYAREMIKYTDGIYLEFGADSHVEGLENEEEKKISLSKKALEPDVEEVAAEETVAVEEVATEE